MDSLRVMLSILCVGPAVVCAQTDWQQLPLLPHLRYPAFTFDAVRGAAVSFGGDTRGVVVDETWLWDRVRWQRVLPAHRPAGRTEAAMVFDAARGVSLLFGGRDAAGLSLGDTWQFDGVDWTRLQPATAPFARSMPAMAFDAARGTVLLFGGDGASLGELADTWEWNGVDWVPRSPLHVPGARAGAAMACDPVRQRLVMFGGSCFRFGPCWRADTWEWDGFDWIDRTQPFPAPAPPARWSHGMCHDAANGRTLVFGGSDEPAHYKDDLWSWDGATWSELLPTSRPVGRLGHGFAYDPGTQQALAFGGESWIDHVSDLWGFAGGWQLLSRGMQPPSQILAHTEVLAATDRGSLWCGIDYAVQGLQTWRWDGERWQFLPTATGPVWPEHHRVVWLPTRRRTVLYQPHRSGWQPEQTYEFDGQDWLLLAPTNQPGVREGADLALDPRLDRLVLFGGRDASGLRGSTWTFDGSDWRPLAVAGPSPREGHAMALDLRTRRVLLFGGSDGASLRSDTYAFDGQQWLPLRPASLPSARRDHAMAYDLARERVVLHGGTTALGQADDTWEWTGSDWLPRPTATRRGGFAHGLAYDPLGEQMLAVGGSVPGTWRYGAVARGTFATFGRPCGGSLGTPAVWTPLGQRPYTGGPFTAHFANLPGTAAFVVVGFSASVWSGGSLPWNLAALGFPRCDLLVEPVAVAAVVPAAGAATWSVQVPALSALVGQQFYEQALALDPSGGDGLAATPGAALRVGGR